MDEDEFKQPDTAYRGCPFWAWNGKLDEERISEQLTAFARMGLGGAMPHARMGLQDEYLGSRFMDCIEHAHNKASELGLLLPLYDEDQWPSGHAGGFVTCNPAFRKRECLIMPDAQEPAPGGDVIGLPGPAARLARWVLRRAEDGRLVEWHRLNEQEMVEPGAECWAAWSRHVTRSWRQNGYTCVDALNGAAMQRFVELTHERYRARLGEAFGQTIPFIFSDEPQIGHQGRFENRWISAAEPSTISIFWTDDLPTTWLQAYDQDLLNELPALLWDTVDTHDLVMRWRWFNHIGQRFATAWTGVPAAWCAEHGLPMTGHMCAENRLTSQILIDADVMRALAPMQLPGVDMLCDWWEPNTLKQASSVAHQFGRERVITELYGVNRWDWPLIGHKRQGDWQYALGANQRVPHLAWYAMAGAAKRDFPQPIDGHAPWARAYRCIEDHFARLGYALTRGRPLIRLAVIHPLESAWIKMGPIAEHAVALEEREKRFAELSDWLIGGLVDFDFIAESLLDELLGPAADGKVQVGAMRYEAVLLPDLSTVRPATLALCERLREAGGRVLVMGRTPDLLCGAPSDAGKTLAAQAEKLPWDRRLLMDTLAPLRDIEVAVATSGQFPWLCGHVRELEQERLVFLCNRSNEVQARNLHGANLRCRGLWRVDTLDTQRGLVSTCPCRHDHNWTEIPFDMPINGSLLLRLRPAQAACAQLDPITLPTWKMQRLDQPKRVTFDEPNVLVLDHGQWRLDNGAWDTCEDLLLLDHALRDQLDLPPAVAQPWCIPPQTVRNHVDLRLTIHCECACTAPQLVCEQTPQTIWLDGQPAPVENTGWWVDRDLRCWRLPDLVAGTHELTLRLAFGTHQGLEWCYLLGDFAVRLRGSETYLYPSEQMLVWGDIGQQGRPFYAGNTAYDLDFEHPGGELIAQTPCFAAHAVELTVNGEVAGYILEERERFSCGVHAAGTLQLRFTALGSRCNAFGPLHNANPDHRMEVPHSWYTSDDQFSRSYRVQAQGILDHPIIWQKESV